MKLTRVTIEHLQALMEAVELAEEFFSTANQDDPDNAHGFRTIELSCQCKAWLQREINRRQRRMIVRNSITEAGRALLSQEQSHER